VFIRMCVGDQRSSLRVDFDGVRHSFHAYGLIQSWRQRAQESLQRGDPFEAFIFDWIAFNGWAERVTQAETDAEWLNALAAEPEIRRCFAEMLATNDRFAATCRRFGRHQKAFDRSQSCRKLNSGRDGLRDAEVCACENQAQLIPRIVSGMAAIRCDRVDAIARRRSVGVAAVPRRRRG
jgi:hypothetical protein